MSTTNPTKLTLPTPPTGSTFTTALVFLNAGFRVAGLLPGGHPIDLHKIDGRDVNAQTAKRNALDFYRANPTAHLALALAGALRLLVLVIESDAGRTWRAAHEATHGPLATAEGTRPDGATVLLFLAPPDLDLAALHSRPGLSVQVDGALPLTGPEACTWTHHGPIAALPEALARLLATPAQPGEGEASTAAATATSEAPRGPAEAPGPEASPPAPVEALGAEASAPSSPPSTPTATAAPAPVGASTTPPVEAPSSSTAPASTRPAPTPPSSPAPSVEAPRSSPPEAPTRPPSLPPVLAFEPPPASSSAPSTPAPATAPAGPEALDLAAPGEPPSTRAAARSSDPVEPPAALPAAPGEAQEAPAPAPPASRLPVLAHDKVEGWPKHSDAPVVAYADIAEALTKRYSTDAHATAYSVEEVPHRLTLDAIARLGGRWRMVLFHVDVDAPGKSEKPADDAAREAKRQRIEAWWADEQPKIAALLAKHPGAFVYRTRSGGYHLVWLLAAPFAIWSIDDKEAWRRFYRRSLCYLARAFRIVGDPACADITRAFRLPHATREPGGTPEELETRGDPAAIGAWTFEPSADTSADLATARTLAANAPLWGSVARSLEPNRVSQEGASPVPPVGPEEQDEERRLKRATAYIDRMPASIDGANGDDALWDAACEAVRGFSLGARTGAALLLRIFNPRCQPPWDRRVIERKCREAADHCDRPWGYRCNAEGGEAGLKHKPSERRQRSTRSTTTTTISPTGSAMHDQANDHDQADGQQAPSSGQRPAPPAGDRPKIEISADLQGNIDQAIAALVGHPTIYTRALTLAQIVDTTDPEAEDKKGGPVLRSLPRPTLREILAASAEWLRFDPRSGGYKAAIPTDAIVQGVESRGYWPTLRPILGIAQTPFLRRDGSVCERPGYDEASGFTLVCRERFPPVPEAPTQADACRALASILDLFCDFPFVDEPARHVPAAALLTMLAMPALGGANTPAFLFEANTPGTGKGLALDVVCILATGREVPKSPWASDEEMSKVLGSAALEGAGILAFDNISPEIPFGGSAIELVLTCSGQYKPRILGRSETPTLPWRAVVLGTGNNIVVRGDTRRRVLLSTQQTELENPEQRDNFKYPHLRQEARQRRGEIVIAALTILRAHALAGRPAAGVRRVGSFEEWGSTVASAIAWAGGANVALAMPRADTSDDPVLSALRVLLEAWPLFDPVGVGLRLGALAEKLYPPPKQRSREEPTEETNDDGLGHVREALEILAPTRGGGRIRFDVRKLGYVLRAHRGRNLGGLAFKEGAVHHGSKTWVAADPKTGLGVRHHGGSGGSGGSSSSDAGASRAHAHEHALEHALERAHAGEPQQGLPTSPTSPTSPIEAGAEGTNGPTDPAASTPPPESIERPRPAPAPTPEPGSPPAPLADPTSTAPQLAGGEAPATNDAQPDDQGGAQQPADEPPRMIDLGGGLAAIEV